MIGIVNHQAGALGRLDRRTTDSDDFPRPSSDHYISDLTTETNTGGSEMGASDLAAPSACERVPWFRKHRGILAKHDPTWTRVGTLVHTGVAYFHASKLPEAGSPDSRWPFEAKPIWFHRYTRHEAMLRDGRGYPRDIETAEAASDGYAVYWKDDRSRPIMVEHAIAVTLGEIDEKAPTELKDVIIRAKNDVVVEHEDGDIWTRDTKTLTVRSKKEDSLDDPHFGVWNPEGNEWTMSWQQMLYLHATRAFFRRYSRHVAGVMIDRVGRNVRAYDRGIIRFKDGPYKSLPRELTAAVRRHRELFERFQDAPDVDVPPASLSTFSFQACYTRFGSCPYFGLCYANNRGEFDANLKRDYRRLTVIK